MKRIKIRKKPIIIEAIEITDELISHLPMYVEKSYIEKIDNETISIQTLEGKLNGHKGDFIIIGVKGECYPIRRDIFFETYDILNDNK